MNSSTTYNVMLTGELTGERNDVVSALADLFKKSEAQIEKLIISAPIAIKKEVEHAVAEKYQKAIESKGARVSLEPIKVPIHASWSLEPTEEELKQASSTPESESAPRGKAQFVAQEVEPEAERIDSRAYQNVDKEENLYATPDSQLVDEETLEYNELTLTQVYFSFNGRINRTTYWLKYFLPFVLGGLLLVGLFFSMPMFGTALFLILAIPFIWATIAVSVKRLHDINLSGWWYLGLAVIPGIAESVIDYTQGPGSVYNLVASLSALLSLALFIMNGFIPGTAGNNKFGAPEYKF